MSKKRRNKLTILSGAQRTPPAVPGQADVLQEALHHLRRGHYAQAAALAMRVQASEHDPLLATAVREVLAEAHFRAAMSSEEMGERLDLLDLALQQTPDAEKLHFHRGVALWRQGRLDEALAELDATAKREPNRSGLVYLRVLGRIATGKTWTVDGLTKAQANTLHLVHGLVQRNPSVISELIQEPLLGKGAELWQALVAMRQDAAAAPVNQLKAAAAQNPRKSVKRILHYYKGVADMRVGDRDAALKAWQEAENAAWHSLVLGENLTALMREEVQGLAEEHRWQDLARLADRLVSSDASSDRIVAETSALAYFHLGYQAAQAGNWRVAAKQWRQAAALDPNRYLAQNLALAEEELGNWSDAAEAWRAMVRRRPRKESHPDYLTDVQVAALWSHAAFCYQQIGAVNETETCLRNAIKYAPNDFAIRLGLADLLIEQGRSDAAESQLQQIVALEPAHIEALVRLARLSEGRWDRDSMSAWRQVLAVNPNHMEARESLADTYSAMFSDDLSFSRFRFLTAYPGKSEVQVLEIGLAELPGHPKLLTALGSAYYRANDNQQARLYLLQAYEAAPQDVRIVYTVLHELLHADAGDAVRELIPHVRRVPNLLPPFWFDEAGSALHCKFNASWAGLFIEEALRLAGEPWVNDTLSGLLIEAYEIVVQEGAHDLAADLEKRIRAEAADSGAVQYLEAYQANFDKHDVRSAKRLIRAAIQTARKANDAGVLRRAQAIESLLSGALTGSMFDRFLNETFPPDLF